MIPTGAGAPRASVEYTLTPDDLAQLNQYVIAALAVAAAAAARSSSASPSPRSSPSG